MFTVTRLAAAMTTLGRKAVKNVAKNKINLTNASDDFKSLYSDNVQSHPYSKNIFKRAYIWIKEFIENYKYLKGFIKETVNKYKDSRNEELTGKVKRQEIKEVKKSLLENIKGIVNSLKKEIKSLKTSSKS